MIFITMGSCGGSFRLRGAEEPQEEVAAGFTRCGCAASRSGIQHPSCRRARGSRRVSICRTRSSLPDCWSETCPDRREPPRRIRCPPASSRSLRYCEGDQRWCPCEREISDGRSLSERYCSVSPSWPPAPRSTCGTTAGTKDCPGTCTSPASQSRCPCRCPTW